MDRNRALEWLDERTGIDALLEVGRHKTVPVHRHSLWYYFGGMTLFLFLVQVGTGILLMLYYRPSADEAYESVQFIMTSVSFGWLIRSIHSWSANLMVGAAFVHLFSVFFMKSYRKPRELTWVSGVVLLFLTMGFGFSGYLLPWNTLAYFATRVGTDIAGAVPVMGEWIRTFLRGGEEVTGATLSRFYGWHVAILPAITASLLGLHLYMVQKHGMSVPPSAEREGDRRTMPFFPNFLLRDIFGWTIALAALAALAAYAPWELGVKADPFAPAPANIKPEWFFMFMFETLKIVPGGEILGVEFEAITILSFGLAGFLLMIVPFLGGDKPGRSKLFTAAGWLSVAYMSILTAIGYGSIWPVVVPAVGIALVLFAGSRGLVVLAFILAGSLLAAPPATAQEAPAQAEESACVACHKTLAEVEESLAAPAVHWEQDVHRDRGLGCVDCHGGDASMEFADEAEASMDQAKGFVGRPERSRLAEFCGRCHSDLTYMRRYNPKVRVDQVTEYRTSVHGMRNAQGDGKVATCIECHGLHGMRPVDNPASPAYPSNVPETCGSCHADEALMAGYGLTTAPVAEWKRSMHGKALLEKGDLSAAACNDCHGNHGAIPPGVTSLAFVCGNCHGREAMLFRESFKKDIFEAMEYNECDSCHGHHEVVHPTDEMIGTGEGTFCGQCHEAGDACDEASTRIRAALDRYSSELHRAEEILDRAHQAGMEVSEPLFLLKNEGFSGLVETRALIHTFDADAMVERAEEGYAVAEAARVSGEEAMEELGFRRAGLGVSLVLILLLLVGLYMKIRQVDQEQSG